MNQESYDAIVLGAGPAGLTAGIYLARAKMRTLIVNEGATGGQLVLTHEIANYPGVESISGYQLATIMKNQAKNFGCTLLSGVSVTAADFNPDAKWVEIDGKVRYSAPVVILAPGGRPRMLGVPGEDKLKGRGVSYCATCDGDFFQDRDIVVVGGGNSALEEAVSLTRYARSVTIVHQFAHFQAFPHAVEEASRNPKIRFVLQSTIADFHGDESLTGVTIQNLATGARTQMGVDGAFVFVGYVPNTECLKGKVGLNAGGEIVVSPHLETDRPGVFAAGDAIAKRYRQVTTAVGEGTVAALSAIDFVRSREARHREAGREAVALNRNMEEVEQ